MTDVKLTRPHVSLREGQCQKSCMWACGVVVVGGVSSNG